MTREVLWSATAVGQLEKIAHYVAQTSPLHAERLINRILSHADQVAEFPESGRRVPEGPADDVREVFEGSYRIMYLVQGTRIDILTVIHARQSIAWPPDDP